MASQYTLDILQLFRVDKGQWPKREFYEEAEEIHEQLEFHAEGQWSDKYIGVERPNEPEDCKAHRKQVWESPTKNYFEKAVSTIGKMRNAEDWQVVFKDDRSYEKAYKEYVTKSFPFDDSLENWFFTMGLPAKLQDPNAVVVVEPIKRPVKDTESARPYPFIYPSEKVLWCEDNEIYVLLEGTVMLEDGEGYIFKIIDRNEINTFVQYGNRGDFTFREDEERSYLHGFGYCPAFKLQGPPKKTTREERLYKSYLSPCMGSWNEACRRSSDLQVNFILHMNPERWEIMDNECPTCNGSGRETKVIGNSKRSISCKDCHGSGATSITGPYNTKLVKLGVKTSSSDFVSGVFPPKGYIARDTKVIELQDEQITKKIHEGLSAINLEWIMNVPLATSGVSKAYDKQESNAFISRVLNDVVDNNLRPLYELVARWMFGSSLSEPEYNDLIPFINKAKKLDYINSDMLAARSQQATQAGFSQSITIPMQLNYAKIELGEDTLEYKRIKAVYDLDPFASKSSDEKLSMQASGTVSRESLILSDNINQFVIRAEHENEAFYDLNYAQQLEMLNKYVIEITSTVQKTTPVDEG